jgi:NhaP-type Na+/H+ or K+/H+ antiporter
MSLKAILFSLGCVIAWFVLLPTLVIGGGIALFAYATFVELGAFLIGAPARTLDPTAAREIAHKMCGGYLVKARGTRRHYSP